MPAPIVAPYATRPGMEEGPAAVAAELPAADPVVVPFDASRPHEDALLDGLPALAAAVAADDSRMPFALLGECTLAPAVTGGLRRRHPGVALVWIDAHGDLNTPETSPSGFLGGMPVAVALGWCHDALRLASNGTTTGSAAGSSAATAAGPSSMPGLVA